MTTERSDDDERFSRDGLSQRDIADLLGISRTRVGFLERQAIRKMRAAAEAEGWSLEDVLREVWR